MFRRSHLPVESATGDWQVEFLEDPDGDVAEGAFVIDSELRAPQGPELGAGGRTRRITTVHLGQRVTTRERTVTRQASSNTRVLARMTHDDESGHHEYDVVKDSVTIGRGGASYPVDVQIASSADVSREHARLKWQEDGWHLEDLGSRNGTFLGEFSAARRIDGSARLDPGAVFRVGNTRLRLLGGPAPRRRARAREEAPVKPR